MKVEIKLGLDKLNNAKLMVFCDTIIAEMTGKEMFDAPEMLAQMKKVSSSVIILRTAINTRVNIDKPDSIKIASDALRRVVTKLKNMVQNQANDPNIADIDREAIVHNAGMITKKHGIATRRVFAAKRGVLSGTINLVAAGCVLGHEWTYTFDIKEYTNIIAIPSTSKARTQIVDLPIKADIACFHKPLKRRCITDWEGPVFITVL
jgi:hypothetical protein